MAPVPPLNPLPPEPPGARIPLRTRSAAGEMDQRPEAAQIVLAKLRGMIASRKQDTETVLGTIAVAAHALTGATGAAIAMPRDGVVLCVGRSGDTAPELGVELNVDSGISGECLRTGQSLRCHDATRDYQVDPEVCRRLGLQSIAVIPLRGQYGRVGVLEAFSTQSYAFTDEHMDILGRLAGLAEAAWARGWETNRPLTRDFLAEDLIAQELPTQDLPIEDLFPQDLPAKDPIVLGKLADDLPEEPLFMSEAFTETPRLTAASVTLTRAGEVLLPGLRGDLRPKRNGRYPAGFTSWIAGLSTVLLVLLSVVIWKAWYRASLPSGSARPAASRAMTPSESSRVAAGAGLTWQPGARHPSLPKTIRAEKARNSQAANQLPDAVFRRQQAPPQTTGGGAAGMDTSANSVSGTADVPQIAASAASSADLTGALSTAPSLPKLSAPISQGVAGGVLVHKVQPAYPAEARRMRLEGTVVLEATITERGEIQGLKVVSGPQLLAAAAMDAVSKWRYTPYLLNGKSVSKQTRINISFIAP